MEKINKSIHEAISFKKLREFSHEDVTPQMGVVLGLPQYLTRVMDMLLRFGKQFKVMCFTQSFLAQKLRISREWVNKCLKELARLKLIVKQNNGVKRVCFIKISSVFYDKDMVHQLKYKFPIISRVILNLAILTPFSPLFTQLRIKELNFNKGGNKQSVIEERDFGKTAQRRVRIGSSYYPAEIFSSTVYGSMVIYRAGDNQFGSTQAHDGRCPIPKTGNGMTRDNGAGIISEVVERISLPLNRDQKIQLTKFGDDVVRKAIAHMEKRAPKDNPVTYLFWLCAKGLAIIEKERQLTAGVINGQNLQTASAQSQIQPATLDVCNVSIPTSNQKLIKVEENYQNQNRYSAAQVRVGNSIYQKMLAEARAAHQERAAAAPTIKQDNGLGVDMARFAQSISVNAADEALLARREFVKKPASASEGYIHPDVPVTRSALKLMPSAEVAYRTLTRLCDPVLAQQIIEEVFSEPAKKEEPVAIEALLKNVVDVLGV